MAGSHIAIPTILKIGSGTLGNVGKYLQSSGFKKAVVFFGNGLVEMFGKTVMDSLSEADIEVLSYCELDTTDIKDIIDLAFTIDAKTQVILGIGGGKVIDAGKYAAYLRKLPFISMPTSASSDGFSSASASLLVNGKRTSVPARMAYGIVVDTDVLKSAPTKFLYSGIGDMVSKITALYDWIFEAEHGVSEVNDFADSLAMSGIANEIAGGSAPTSGSEHLISHALDKLLEVPQLHGVQVGIATYVMAVVQDHRYVRVNKIFEDTGFWDFVSTLGLNRADYESAIDMAPQIKPNRYTYLHEAKYREKAKQVLREDPVMKRVFGE